jgi:hypothetical protein
MSTINNNVTGKKGSSPLEPLAVTVRQAREISSLGTTTIYALIASGKLETTTIGCRRLVIFKSLRQLIERGVE